MAAIGGGKNVLQRGRLSAKLNLIICGDNPCFKKAPKVGFSSLAARTSKRHRNSK
jgi:hypothetical protein